jgi:Uma2 family endonuclease
MRLAYYEASQEYLRSLPPEHFMESTTQATQREITLESLALVKARRPDIQVFNELLVQYEVPGRDKPGQVVPDNMIVVHPEPLQADGSYDIPFQPVGPTCVLEYVSKSNKRKDYDDNMRKYERELKVPYYLLFFPDAQELSVYQLNADRNYVSVKPNQDGRLAIPELELQVALLGRWVRYWFRGELLPLPGDYQRNMDLALSRCDVADTQRDEAVTQRDEAVAQRDEAVALLAEAQTRFEQERLAFQQEIARLRAHQPPAAD